MTMDDDGPRAGAMDRNNNDRAWTLIRDNLRKYRRVVPLYGFYHYLLKVTTIVGAGAPAAILLINPDPGVLLRSLAGGAAAFAFLAAAVDTGIETRRMYLNARSARSRTEQLANNYVGGKITREQAMEELNRIDSQYEDARVKTIG
jgi:hypothetical protein